MLDKNLTPQNPVHPAVARILINERKASIYKRFPFVLRLKAVSKREPHGLQLKLDPGSVTTGIALVNNQTGEIVWGAEIVHRGSFIKKRMEARRALRQNRRNRDTRYRPARFLNRTKPTGWLAPSLMSHIFNIETWVRRLIGYAFINGISVEHCKFDTQKMVNPAIKGKEYQRGELFEFEVREYLLQRYNYTCVYCGIKKVPFEIEHVIPKARGGSNRISNLVLACEKCNKKKGARSIEEFLRDKPELLNRIKAGLKKPLRDASVLNSTRWELVMRLHGFGLPVELGFGYITKFNRVQQKLPKAHWIDAACVGNNTPALKNTSIVPLLIKAVGHGSRQRCRTNKFGFPAKHIERTKVYFGFQTGDMVKARMAGGKNKGLYLGKVSVRKRPSFLVQGVDGIHPKNITMIQKTTGYCYNNEVSITREAA